MSITGTFILFCKLQNANYFRFILKIILTEENNLNLRNNSLFSYTLVISQFYFIVIESTESTYLDIKHEEDKSPNSERISTILIIT